MFQENLRLKRRERGLSQEELASRLHVVRQTISKWEKGQSVPDAEQLIKIAVILKTTVSPERIFLHSWSASALW